MTQVWMIRNSDTDIHLFNRFEHLEPSIRISYSRCKDVTVTITKAEPQTVEYVIEGKREGIAFIETILAHRFPVWTEPSHL